MLFQNTMKGVIRPEDKTEVGLLPMIPVITVITSYHGTAIISFVASRTNPDLVSPFISYLPEMQTTENKSNTLLHDTIVE